MQKRLIDAGEAVKKLRGDCIKKYPITYSWGLIAAAKEIEDMQTVDAVEVVHGTWKKSYIPNEKFRCSVCGGACWYYDYDGEVAKSRYCPNCGAKMDGERSEQ